MDRKKISGTTWDVYLHIITSEQPRGVREIWRGLELSSPSLAQYHINKLLELDLIKSDRYGKYLANEIERIGVLRNFVILRGRLLPRLVFYGAFIFGILLMYVLFWPFRWDFRDLVVLSVSVFSITTFFFEAYNQYKGIVQR